MQILRVQDILKDRILVSRESARLLDQALNAMIAAASSADQAGDTAAITIDFEGVEGMAPSFVDELLCVFESLASAASAGQTRCLRILHPPTRLSSKFEAVARGHAMSVQVQPDGSWLLTGNSGGIR